MSCLTRMLVAAPLAMIVACAPVVVSKSNTTDNGISYYLPKRFIKIQVDRTPAATSKDLEKAKADLATATDDNKKASGVVDDAQKKLDEIAKTGTTSAAYAEQAKVLALAQADASLTKAALADAQSAFNAAAQAQLRATNGDPPLVDTITVTVLPPTADKKQSFVAIPTHIGSRNDQFALKTNTAGLLTNADATAEDQTASIIVAIAGAVAGVRVVTPLPNQLMRAPSAPAAPSCGNGYLPPPSKARPFSIEFVLDPMEDLDTPPSTLNSWPLSLKQFESELCSLGAHYLFRLNEKLAATAASSIDSPGLYYRRELPYLLYVFARDDARNAPVLSKGLLIALPNNAPAELIPLEGSAFATRVFSVTFDNGILTSHTETKPSEWLAVAKIPVDILKAIFQIPTDLITLKVNYTNQQKDLADAKKALIDARKALEPTQPTN